jgi:hypothetical protein
VCIRQALGSIESAIRLELTEVGSCTLEELTERLPYYSWNQMLIVVDRLSREGTITLQRSDSLGYILSLAPSQPIEARPVTAVEAPSHTLCTTKT